MNKINIAIDGPTGSGKSTTSKLLAKKLGYSHLDTGAMYRVIGYLLNTKYNFNKFNFDPNILKDLKFEIKFDENNHIILNGENLESQIRTPLCGQLASDFSTIPQIREYLVKIQKKIVKSKKYIAEGRDICNVVMPDAELKIYLNASIDVRVKRRLDEYLKKGIVLNFKEVKKQIILKDTQDRTRENSPLIKTKDSIEIDTSNLTIEQQVDKIYNLANAILNN